MPRLLADPFRVWIPVVPPGGGVNSSGFFEVKALGDLRVDLTVRTAALFNSGGRSAYVISVRRGNPALSNSPAGIEIASKRVVTDSQKARVELVVPIRSCNDIGVHHVRVSNVSENPQMGIVGSVEDNFFVMVTPNTETRDLDMAGMTVLDLDRGAERTVNIGSFPKPGLISLKGKWHVPAIIPTYKPLKIYFRRPDGTTVTSGTFYSFHSPSIVTGTRLKIEHRVTAEEAKQAGSWTLRIVNAGDSRIEGFDIQKGSDPVVLWDMKSTFTTACGG